jgi:hypothetical protein
MFLGHLHREGDSSVLRRGDASLTILQSGDTWAVQFSVPGEKDTISTYNSEHAEADASREFLRCAKDFFAET